MAGLCGCWKLSSHGHCDGCGYKVLLRGALNPGGQPFKQDKSAAQQQQQQQRDAPPQPVLIKKEKKDESKFSPIETPIRQLQSSPSQHRRHSHPFHLVTEGARDKPQEPQTQTQSLQRRHPHALPQSSAYNVPLPTDPSLPPKETFQHPWSHGPAAATGAAAAAAFTHDRATSFFRYAGDERDQHWGVCRLGSAYPHQMLLSTMQPPEELRAPSWAPVHPSLQPLDAVLQDITHLPSLPSSPRPGHRPPPFDLSSFIPPLSPNIVGGQEQEGFFGGAMALGPASNLHTRYHALSLARASSRSHTDLRETTPLSSASTSPKSSSGSRPNSMYNSFTLPPPPPPPRARRFSVRKPQESNRSQPAIGLKQTQKARPTIFGTVADDQTPRDNNTKRGLPQTPKSGAKSCPYNGVEHASHAPEWATTPDDDNSLVYEDGVLVSGSLQALIQHAVPTAVYYPDTAYLFAFLLSSRLFIKPHELLQRVCDVGFTQQGLKGNDMSTINKEKLGRFVPHMVQLLGEWSETFPYDFRDERMMGGVRTMTHRCIALEPALRRDVTQVLHNLLNKLTQLERYEEGLAKMSPPPPADFIPQPTDITEVCESPLVMAQQLTHIELEKLSYIGPEEFVQAFAKDNLDACYKDLKKTSNLESYIQWFNRLSYLVATHACTHVKKKQRVRVIEWWIEVARECFNIGNFNSLMGIIAGLNMSIVSRLKKTWSKVQSAKFSVLEHQMDPSSNFSSYRSTLKAAMWRSAGAVDDRQKIVIPFFSLLVKDLYFLNEGCASRLPNGHINFDKFWQLAKQVTEFMAWKQVTCPFEKVPDVINYMQTTAVLTETGLALASFECEGPDNSYEKERYKSLKSDTQQPAEKTNPHD
ncbi:ras-GEF domain-containing family member 1B-like isoform X2 [Panulirus ornatus]|uniref:ras-GEF domain-containing family member 1B-like isoform X2 n=1 Tax=Panulirus ornatus TaxID=150431 RepID=UPI003A857252